MIQGTNCSSCGALNTWFTVNDAQYLSGYTIQAGDKLYWRQYQSNARGGTGIFFRDGSNNAWGGKDQNGYYTNDDPNQNTWDRRIVDLSSYAGKVISWIGLDNDSNSPAGAWSIVFGDITLVSADGTVHAIYNGAANFSVSLNWTTAGVTGVSVSNRHLSGLGPATVTEVSTQYYHEDHLGTSRVMTTASGWPVWQGTFAPFGQEVSPQITMNHYKFTGKERDNESALDMFGARYYGSSMGRFMTPDWAGKPTAVPYANFGNPQSLNLYSYVQNNPTTVGDPDGHETQDTLDPQAAQDAGQVIAGAGVALWNGVAGVWNIPSQLLNDQTGYGLPLLPTASYDNTTQVVAGAVVQLGTLVYAGAESATAAAGAEGATAAGETGISVPKEGIYEGADATAPGRTYVGQSGDIPSRLAQHEASGKFPAGTKVTATEVTGGKAAREVAEHNRIQQRGGVRSKSGSQTSNIRNPIGKKRWHLLKKPTDEE